MNYSSITYSERYEIERMRNPYQKKQYKISTIAKRLNCSNSSIYREIQYNSLNSKWYDAEYAQNAIEKRRSAPRRCTKTDNIEIMQQVSKYFSLGLPPDLMVGRAKVEGIYFPISCTAIYTLIYKDEARQGY